MNQEERWLLQEKYNGQKNAPVFNESLDEIKNKYPWGEDFLADRERLNAGEPLAYVIGSIPFLGITVFLDSHPLIPRAETEFWVEKAITDIEASGIKAPHVLDLCAGSGCIGIAVAKAIPNAFIDLVEINSAHHGTIDRTISLNGVDPSRCRIIVSDLFKELDAERQYDFILSNPPYIDKELQRTQESVIAYEPHEALFAEKRGLALIERIMSGAGAFLSEGGIVYIEHEPEQAEAIASMAETAGLEAATHTDQYKVARYSTFRMAKLS